jgi:hypothetical protein
VGGDAALHSSDEGGVAGRRDSVGSVESVASMAAESLAARDASSRGVSFGARRPPHGGGGGSAGGSMLAVTPSSARTFIVGSWMGGGGDTGASRRTSVDVWPPPGTSASVGGVGGGGGGGRGGGRGSGRDGGRGGGRGGLSSSFAAAATSLSFVSVVTLASFYGGGGVSAGAHYGQEVLHIGGGGGEMGSGSRFLLGTSPAPGYEHQPLIAAPPWVGAALGWTMTAIYLSGRVPQIIMNHKRGTVEGLSISMFTLAVIGNATYMASILARSCAWWRIKPNLPWWGCTSCIQMTHFSSSASSASSSSRLQALRYDVIFQPLIL